MASWQKDCLTGSHRICGFRHQIVTIWTPKLGVTDWIPKNEKTFRDCRKTLQYS